MTKRLIRELTLTKVKGHATTTTALLSRHRLTIVSMSQSAGDVVKAKPVRVREEIPEYEDPTAELAKLPTDLV